MQETDQSLTSAAIAGDRIALRELIRRHDSTLRSHIAEKIRATHRAAFDAEDVLQVTYIEVFLQIGSFRSTARGAFKAWLWRIAENNLVDAVRALERDKRPPRDRQVTSPTHGDPHTTLLARLEGAGTTPSGHLSRKESKLRLDAAMKSLPADYQTVVRLCDLEGLSAEEVAKSMNRTRMSVYMLKARAHERLAKFLGQPSSS